MIRIAIVEDEKSYIDTLTAYLERYEKKNGTAFQIHTFCIGVCLRLRQGPVLLPHAYHRPVSAVGYVEIRKLRVQMKTCLFQPLKQRYVS